MIWMEQSQIFINRYDFPFVCFLRTLFIIPASSRRRQSSQTATDQKRFNSIGNANFPAENRVTFGQAIRLFSPSERSFCS